MRVEGWGFRVQGSGFRVQGAGFRGGTLAQRGGVRAVLRDGIDIGVLEKSCSRPRGQASGTTIQGYLAQKKHPPLLGPYSRAIPRVLWWS